MIHSIVKGVPGTLWSTTLYIISSSSNLRLSLSWLLYRCTKVIAHAQNHLSAIYKLFINYFLIYLVTLQLGRILLNMFQSLK